MDSFYTEAEESLIGSQHKWQQEGNSGCKSRLWTTIKFTFWIINTALLLMIAALLLESREQKRFNSLEFAGDLTGFAPRCELLKLSPVSLINPEPNFLSVSQQVKVFKPDLTFVPQNTSDFWSQTVQDKWLSIVPSAGTNALLYQT